MTDLDLLLPLSPAERVEAFKRALGSTANALARWRERAAAGLSDTDLAAACERELGIAGGSGCETCVAYQGAGLKIWAARDWPNPHLDEPLWQGAATLRMAREVYGVREPGDGQLSLF
jgi:hypothetical protein